MADYGAALDQLRSEGVLYRCFRTRKETAERAASAPHGPEPLLEGEARGAEEEADRLARGEPFAWRLSLRAARERLGDAYDQLTFTDVDLGELQARPDRAGDVVLARKDVGVAYHLASVVDDALQGVTHVIRGEDLKEAIHVQRLLQALLGLQPPVYRHHRLILGADGRRLAKRDAAARLADLRARGVKPDDVRADLGLLSPPSPARG